MEWNGMEWTGMEWNGMAWKWKWKWNGNGMEWNIFAHKNIYNGNIVKI
jgi:hypothetical protein